MTADARRGTVIVRDAASADAALLAELGERTFRDAFGSENTPENMADYVASAFGLEIQARQLARPGSTFLIAEAGDRAVGYAHLLQGPAPAPVLGERPIEIVRFYAEKDWIGRGVGAALMTACLERAREMGCDAAWLSAWEQNPRALIFYKRFGFVAVGTQEFRLGGDRQRDFVMARAVGRDRPCCDRAPRA